MDPSARDDFVALYESAAPRLVAALSVIVGDRDLAVEAVADAFVKAFERWERVRIAENPGGWVFTVALNGVRRRRRRSDREAKLLASFAVDESVLGGVDGQELWSLVARLPWRMRCAMTLRYVAGFKELEIAEALGVTRGTVATLLHRGRARLAAELRDGAEVRDA